MGKLEQDVGVKLFERSPFRLTPAGAGLFAHVQPFFEGLEGVAAELRRTTQPELRIGGAELVLRDHLPVVMRRLRAEFPKLRFSLRTTGFQSEVETWLRAGHIDVAFTPLPARRAGGFANGAFHDAAAGAAGAPEVGGEIGGRTLGAKENHRTADLFTGKLRNRAQFFPSVEAPRSELAANRRNDVARLGDPLRGERRRDRPQRHGRSKAEIARCAVASVGWISFLTMGALWRGETNALQKAAIDGVRTYAQATWPGLSLQE